MNYPIMCQCSQPFRNESDFHKHVRSYHGSWRYDWWRRPPELKRPTASPAPAPEPDNRPDATALLTKRELSAVFGSDA